MKLIIGLGNPGEKYKFCRHNVGFMVVNKLKNQKSKVKSFRTSTFMNDSGDFVLSKVKELKLKPEDLIIVHDDLDLPLGKWKIQYGKGPDKHGGINDIEQKLETKDFWRVRVGVDRRSSEDRTPGDEYVLQDFTEEEKKILEGVIQEIIVQPLFLCRNRTRDRLHHLS